MHVQPSRDPSHLPTDSPTRAPSKGPSTLSLISPGVTYLDPCEEQFYFGYNDYTKMSTSGVSSCLHGDWSDDDASHFGMLVTTNASSGIHSVDISYRIWMVCLCLSFSLLSCPLLSSRRSSHS